VTNNARGDVTSGIEQRYCGFLDYVLPYFGYSMKVYVEAEDEDTGGS